MASAEAPTYSNIVNSAHVNDTYATYSQQRDKSVVIEDDVRRFACDRCRSQKLRCERKQVSLKIPLKQIPCKRCQKLGIRCTTNPQTRPRDSVRRLPRKSTKNLTALNNHHDDLTGSDDQEENAGMGEEGDMMEVEFQTDDFCVTRQHPSDGTGTVSPGPHRMRVQTIPTTTCSGTHGSSYSPHFGLNRMPTPARSDATAVQDQDYQMAQMLQDFVTVPSEENLRTLDPALFHEANLDMTGGFPPNDDSGVHGFPSADMANGASGSMDVDVRHTRAMLPIYNPSAQRRVFMQQHPQQSETRRSHTSSDASGRPATAPAAPPTVHAQAQLLPGQQLPTATIYLLLASKLSLLTNRILQDISVQSTGQLNETFRSDQQHGTEDAGSPLPKLLERLDEMVTVLGEAPLSGRQRQASVDGTSNKTQQSSSNTERPAHTRVQSENVNAYRGSFGSGDGIGLARLSFVTALASTYTTTLQAYHHIFHSIQESSASIDDLALHLPLIQLGGPKYSMGRQLRVHLTLEMALQELNRLEDRLKHVMVEHQTDTGEAEVCSLAVLSSLIDDGGESMSASACVRGTIHSLQKLLVVERKQ